MNFYVGSYSRCTQGTVCEINFDALVNSNKNDEVCTKIDAGPCPSFMCVDERTGVLYVVNELDESQDGTHGRVVALKKREGGYEKISDYSTFGNYPCHVSVDQGTRFLFVVNYGSGSVCAYELDSDGVIKAHVQTYECSQHFVEMGPHAKRQAHSHTHQALCSPDGAHLLVSDLGSDCIYTFSVIAGAVEPLALAHVNHVPRGSGPRHMVFSACKNYLYVSAELSSALLVFRYISSTGELSFLCSVPVFAHEAQPYPRTYAAEVAQHGHYVYMSNRGDDSIAVFDARRAESPKFVRTVSSGGEIPRHFKVFSAAYWGGDATLLVANRVSNSLVCFSVHGDTLVEKKRIEGIESPAVVC